MKYSIAVDVDTFQEGTAKAIRAALIRAASRWLPSVAVIGISPLQTGRHDVAAHDPESGELLRMYRAASAEELPGLRRALREQFPAAEINTREHEE